MGQISIHPLNNMKGVSNKIVETFPSDHYWPLKHDNQDVIGDWHFNEPSDADINYTGSYAIFNGIDYLYYNNYENYTYDSEYTLSGIFSFPEIPTNTTVLGSYNGKFASSFGGIRIYNNRIYFYVKSINLFSGYASEHTPINSEFLIAVTKKNNVFTAYYNDQVCQKIIDDPTSSGFNVNIGYTSKTLPSGSTVRDVRYWSKELTYSELYDIYY